MDALNIATTALQVGTGLFFACSGGNKLALPARHAALVATLQEDKVPLVGLMQWWVPSWEFAGGLMLAGNVFPRFAAAILLVIMLVAIVCEGRKRVAAYAPANVPDRICDWLYLPEVVYALVLTTFVVR